MTTLLLATLAFIFAGPTPALLARLPVLRRTPGVTLCLWQSIALAAVLAALGTGLSLFTSYDWTAADRGRPSWPLAIAVLALIVTGLVTVRLLLSAHRVGTSLREARRRHRAQVELVAERQGAMRVVDFDVPVAYCVPGMGQSQVVVSAGALQTLAESELAAVLAHERSHLRARHDLVLEAFTVVHTAFPRWVSSSAALGEVRLLVEVLADRAAIREVGPRPLARALLALAEGRTPLAALGAAGGTVSALGVAGGTLSARVELMVEAGRHPLQTGLVAALAVAVLVLPTALVVLPWLTSLRA